MPKVKELNHLHPSDCEALRAIRLKYARFNFHYNQASTGTYIRYSVNGSVLSEHVLVAEYVFGSIPDGHHVHHIDENKHNNAASNLEVICASEHSRLHMEISGRISERITLKCPVCAKSFKVREYLYVVRNRKYCSARCSSKDRKRKSKKPQKDELLPIVFSVRNYCELGRMFGVSDNAVRKWVKSYGVDPKSVY